MAKELILNRNFGETRIGFIENGEILDFLIERSENDEKDLPSVGNIYMGKVLRVLPGMQSAFVDIGYEKAAFLYVDDAYLPTLEEQRAMIEKFKEHQDENQKKTIGALIPDEFSTLSDSVDMRFRPEVSIESFLKEGDNILVQVAKEPISTKGPRVTRQITLAGRHIVFLPFIEHIGVSRRIQNEEERERLKVILEAFKLVGKGIIARTVAEGQSAKILKSDLSMLMKIWSEIENKAHKNKLPYLVHKDLTFAQRVLRDIIDEDIESIYVDNKDDFKQVEKFISKYLPNLKGKTKHYTLSQPIFEHFGIEIEVQRALGNKIFLKSGGSINIDQTEALVSIDVNTGKFVGRKTLEETILQTNLEAVKEIAYQLRLRNCGGIIIIDFIDMQKDEHKEQVYTAFLEALKKDRAKTNVLPISGLGLIEMTRKRTRDTLTRIMSSNCPYCEGTGRVKSTLTVCFEILRETTKVLKKSKVSKIQVFAHPQVSSRLCDGEMDVIEAIEEAYDAHLIIRAENSYHIEQYEIVAAPR